ncbi:ribosomal protein L6, alpha-beta domain-containing protein [Pelagophyceae sp. CCMP2097]|nr:ribosomal protein L6, alpha-beta domain-containing protein [Pelagophyceae sp. CCMP2097]|eukprot:CAMPEP_0184083870 /NCGR_PEP_ID=MMETSP0974-20121125/3923_1 /TAXON_ID=483370 /ORGANISM="non described non described, Strain CCMP2097" /LENGTH=186 /DNA_ID=CAMNT_0026386547 /DNA_START=45 /DNA_END=605 /DNA_ORIENTATION=-
MKTVLGTRFLEIPDGVEVAIKARTVTVTGPRGTLVRAFKHMNLELTLLESKLRIDLWFGTRKQTASIRTIASHIENMIIGVTRGFQYKMRFVYSHFPINVSLAHNTVEIRNFLGDKLVRRVPLIDGVEYVRTADVKDQIELLGNDITTVSLCAARIRQICAIRNKDLRKFLDGIFVSWKGPIPIGE